MTSSQLNFREKYKAFASIQTRWMDNDVYGHVNNVTYYSYFDTAVNCYLIRKGVLDITSGDVIGLVVETGCQYFASVAFPDQLDVGIRVAHIGRTSVRYEIGVFKEGETGCYATGHFVHVYVDRETRRPMALSPALLEVLQQLTGD